MKLPDNGEYVVEYIGLDPFVIGPGGGRREAVDLQRQAVGGRCQLAHHQGHVLANAGVGVQIGIQVGALQKRPRRRAIEDRPRLIKERPEVRAARRPDAVLIKGAAEIDEGAQDRLYRLLVEERDARLAVLEQRLDLLVGVALVVGGDEDERLPVRVVAAVV